MAPKHQFITDSPNALGEAYLQDVADTIVGAPGLFKKWIVDDAEMAVNIAAYGGGGSVPETALRMGDEPSYSGVTVSFSANPLTIIKHPDKWAKALFTSTLGSKGIFNRSDFQLYWERDFYTRLMNDQDALVADLWQVGGFVPGARTLLKKWDLPEEIGKLDVKKRVIEKAIRADLLDTTPLANGDTATLVLDDTASGIQGTVLVRDAHVGDPDAFLVRDAGSASVGPQLTTSGPSTGVPQLTRADGSPVDGVHLTIVGEQMYSPTVTHHIYEKDLIRDYQAKVRNFVGTDKIGLYREGNYRQVQFAALDIYREVVDPDKSGIRKNAIYQKSLGIDKTTGLPTPGTNKIPVSLNDPMPRIPAAFVLKVDMAEKLNDIDTAMLSFSKGLGSFITERGNTQGLSFSSPEDLKKNLTNLQDGFTQIFGGVDSNGKKVESMVRQVSDLYGKGSKELADFEATIRPLRDYHDKLLKTGFMHRSTATAADGSTFMEFDVVKKLTDFKPGNILQTEKEITALKIFKGELDTIRKQYSGAIADGPIKVFFRHLELEITDKNSVINKYVKSQGVSLDGVNEILKMMSKKRSWEEAGEYLQQLDKGKLTTYLLWINGVQLQNRVRMFTPAYYLQEYVMKKTHYFGFVLQDRSEVKTYAFWDKIVDNWGIFKNNFTLEFAGVKVKVRGGAHFSTLLQLQGYFEKGYFNASVSKAGKIMFSDGGKAFAAIMNAKDVNDMLRMAHQLDFLLPPGGEEELIKFFNKIQVLKKYLKENPVLKNLFFDSNGVFKLDAIAKFNALTERIWQMKGLAHFTNVTEETLGLAQKASVYLSMLQKRLFDLIPGASYVGKFLSLKAAISEAISTAIAGLLDAVTGGVLTPFISVIQKIINVVVRKIVDTAGKGLGALARGNVGEFIHIFDDMLSNIAKFVGVATGAVALGALIIVAVFSGAIGGVPPDLPTKGYSDVSSFGGSGGGVIPPIGSGECFSNPPSAPPTPTGLPVPANEIAAEALRLVDNLRPGFWCWNNYSPDYPALFDMPLFVRHPNHCLYSPTDPEGCTQDEPDSYLTVINGETVFWCSTLTSRAYSNTGNGPIGSGAAGQRQFALEAGTLLDETEDVRGLVRPGDLIFLYTNTVSAANKTADHVAIVYSVSQDNIRSIDANTNSKINNYTIDAVTGRVQSAQSWFIYGGIGLQ